MHAHLCVRVLLRFLVSLSDGTILYTYTRASITKRFGFSPGDMMYTPYLYSHPAFITARGLISSGNTGLMLPNPHFHPPLPSGCKGLGVFGWRHNRMHTSLQSHPLPCLCDRFVFAGWHGVCIQPSIPPPVPLFQRFWSLNVIMRYAHRHPLISL